MAPGRDQGFPGPARPGDPEVTGLERDDHDHALEQSYRRGFQDGYQRAETAANNTWRGQEQVFHAGSWLDGPTAAEKYAERQAVIREAHLAGVHGAGRQGCDWCASIRRNALERSSTSLFVPSPADNAKCVCIDGKPCPVHTASEVHHKGHYGVPADCPAHGPHPHELRGGRCLDCPVCAGSDRTGTHVFEPRESDGLCGAIIRYRVTGDPEPRNVPCGGERTHKSHYGVPAPRHTCRIDPVDGLCLVYGHTIKPHYAPCGLHGTRGCAADCEGRGGDRSALEAGPPGANDS
jgi:hypothetical protein